MLLSHWNALHWNDFNTWVKVCGGNTWVEVCGGNHCSLSDSFTVVLHRSWWPPGKNVLRNPPSIELVLCNDDSDVKWINQSTSHHFCCVVWWQWCKDAKTIWISRSSNWWKYLVFNMLWAITVQMKTYFVVNRWILNCILVGWITGVEDMHMEILDQSFRRWRPSEIIMRVPACKCARVTLRVVVVIQSVCHHSSSLSVICRSNDLVIDGIPILYFVFIVSNLMLFTSF